MAIKIEVSNISLRINRWSQIWAIACKNIGILSEYAENNYAFKKIHILWSLSATMFVSSLYH